jgi:hypothetical protein
MKPSKLMHVASIVVGFIGVISFLIAVFGDSQAVFGITKADTLMCSAVLVLIAIWTQIATIHHMMLEKQGEII